MAMELESVFMVFMLVILFFFMLVIMMNMLQLQKGSVIIERDEQGRIVAIHYA